MRNGNYHSPEVKAETSGVISQSHDDPTHEMFRYSDITKVTDGILNEKELFRLYSGKWVLFMRRNFDCFVDGEPYLALSFLLHLESGQFVSRVWNKTISTGYINDCLLYTSPSPRDRQKSRMPSSA